MNNQTNIYKDFPQEQMPTRADEIREDLLKLFVRKRFTKHEIDTINELISQLITLELKMKMEE
ncbi:MAG: hypothetical protein WCH10_07115 [bacterium]